MRDGVWTRGEITELDAWISGESRTVAVTREAIENYLAVSPEEAAAMSADERRRFVRNNISLVVAAANRKAHASDHAADAITIRRGEL
jgi:hypothetical protein